MTFGTQTYGSGEYGGADSSTPEVVGEEGFGVATLVAWGTATGLKSTSRSAASATVGVGGATGGGGRSGSAADAWSLFTSSAHGLPREAWAGAGLVQALAFATAAGSKQASGTSGGASLGFGVAVGLEAPQVFGAGAGTTIGHGAASGSKASSSAADGSSVIYPLAVPSQAREGAASATAVPWARAFGGRDGTGVGAGLFISWATADGEPSATSPVVLTLAVLSSSWALAGFSSEVTIQVLGDQVVASSTEAISRKVDP